jgi:hypothetical protein
MEPQPNAAEGRLAEAIRRMGQAGFETALTGWLRRSVPCDNLIVLAYREAGPPLVLYHQADDPKVYGQLDSTYLAGAYLLVALARRRHDPLPEPLHTALLFLLSASAEGRGAVG